MGHESKKNNIKNTVPPANLKPVIKNNVVDIKNNTVLSSTRGPGYVQRPNLASASHQSKKNNMDKENNTGLPDNLKTGMENLSGMSLDKVNVHYNSSKPAAVQAHAYAQGTNIHLGSGQAKHLPHELGHVVQQWGGR